ncbi:MAG: glycosyl-4,4'-diaponeurosporenoate acyltransferase CrtO family protein [Candidatus Nanopelagicales bacterium]
MSAGLLVVDISVIVTLSVIIGASAPRWPERWLRSDVGPLRRLPGETARLYRRIGVSTLIRRLPEMGTLFGGESKSALPGMSVPDLRRYLREDRRAEWVHWGSIAATLVIFAFNPWQLALVLWLLVAAGNLPFIAILRHNRLRILGILERKDAARDD